MRRTHTRLPPPTGSLAKRGASSNKTPSPTLLPADDQVEIIDLGDDLIEESAAPPVAAPPAVRRTRRHRRPTLRSTISAELAEVMGQGTGTDEREAAPEPVAEMLTSGAIVEVSIPTAVEVTSPTSAAAAAVTGRVSSVPAPSEVQQGGPADDGLDDDPYVSMDAAVPMTAIHDDVTVQILSEASASGAVSAVAAVSETSETDLGDLGHTAVTAVGPRPWRALTLEGPRTDVVTARPAFARPRLSSLDLRGVFCSDGAAIASDPVLPDEIFVLPPRVRALAPLSSGMSTRSAGAALISVGLRRAAGEGGERALQPGLGALAPRGSARSSGRRAQEESLPRGAIIDKYRVEKLLGRGGFAAVYRATHLLLNTQVAIKLLRPQVLAKHAHLAKLLYEEARFAARIDHPNVVKVFDVTHTPSITYIVMEYIDGRSLADTIARGRALPWPRVVEIGAAVATGLKVALEARLIHRDIKPANILLGKRGEIKIVDLGLVLRAGTMAPDQGAAAEVDPGSTGRRAAIGTFGYMAPEQAVDPERIDFRADIYALGATLYEAAVGAPPFPLGNAARCIEMHARELPPAPESRRPGLPHELSALLMRMLAKKPDDRFPSYDALIAELKRVAALAAPPAVHPSN